MLRWLRWLMLAAVLGPLTAAAEPGVVLVHDWFGVTPFYTQAASRLERQGYRVVAVDLYGGRTATTHDEAAVLMQGVDAEAAARQIDVAVRSLSDVPRRIALVGFSMGARHALNAAARHKAVAAMVLWYGETSRDMATLRRLSGPVLLVTGSQDGPAAEHAAAFSRAMDDAGAGAEVYLYPGAAHAFAQPLFGGGRGLDPAATQAAWALTEDFLRRRIK